MVARTADQSRAAPAEMTLPALLSRLKKPGFFSGLCIDPAKIGSLVAIAGEARQGEILERCLAIMFLGDDMLDLERECVEPLVHLAVFAAVASSAPHALFERDGH